MYLHWNYIDLITERFVDVNNICVVSFEKLVVFAVNLIKLKKIYSFRN